jgi:hypothetical protein
MNKSYFLQQNKSVFFQDSESGTTVQKRSTLESLFRVKIKGQDLG